MKSKTLKTTLLLSAVFILLLIVAAGCGDDSSITGTQNENESDNVTVSIKSDDGAMDNGNIVITDAKALITEVELETEPSGNTQHIHVSPFVIHFNTNGTLVSFTSGNIPAGNYNKIKFKIHKPEDNESIPDPEFREGSSGNQRYSFIIKGTFNGNSFVYKSRRSSSLVINLNTILNVQNSSRNITVLVNPSMWFNNGSIDPSSSQHENEIDDNLKNSFRRAFRDDNRDGLPDDN